MFSRKKKKKRLIMKMFCSFLQKQNTDGVFSDEQEYTLFPLIWLRIQHTTILVPLVWLTFILCLSFIKFHFYIWTSREKLTADFTKQVPFKTFCLKRKFLCYYSPSVSPSPTHWGGRGARKQHLVLLSLWKQGSCTRNRTRNRLW